MRYIATFQNGLIQVFKFKRSYIFVDYHKPADRRKFQFLANRYSGNVLASLLGEVNNGK